MTSRKTRTQKARTRSRPGTRTKTPTGATAEDSHDLLVAGWSQSRAGARSNRGYHFQDAVGAWLAARVAIGELAGDLIPEGFDDMTLEDPESNNHQIKSRVEHLGPFPAATAAGHLFDAWGANNARPQPSSMITVVLERGVATTENLTDPNARLASILAAGSPLEVAIRRGAKGRGLSRDDLTAVLARTVALGLAWSDVDDRTDVLTSSLATVPPAARPVLRRTLYASVARATDHNSSADYDHRQRLTRTELVADVAATAELIDVAGLEAAVRDGLCSPLRYDADPAVTDAFYEGTSSLPTHLASGLIVPRPELAAQIVAALDAGQPVVIVGPSGVGKSAIAWTVPAALTGVLWFNIHRLETSADATALLRLARTHGAAPGAPVGLVLDGAGTPGRTGWAELRALAATTPGIVLLATARNEDLPTLGTLTDVASVAVALDEPAAATIFDGLRRRGATNAPHWREAFESSEGLTLEYTHLLTRGERIDDVISEQIRTRLVERRDDELQLLGVVAMADQWSATVDTATVLAATGATDLELRRSIERLAREHLLVERDGVLTGLHPVRSEAITRAIHRSPPPTLEGTLTRTLELVPDHQIARFVVRALRDDPSLAPTVMDAAERSVADPDRLTAYLEGLRIADIEIRVQRWIDILEQQQVRRSLRLALVLFTTASLDQDLFPPPVVRAVEAMQALPPGNLQDQLADRLGTATISRAVTASTVERASVLVAALDRWAGTIEPSIDSTTPLGQDLATASIEAVTGLLAVASRREDRLAADLIDALGGADALLRRLHGENPWILRAELRDSPEGPVGYARLLHLSDGHQGDSRENCVALARHLLRILPEIRSTDVKVRGPGYTSIIFDGYEHGSSGLVRDYDHPEATVRWNQELLKAAADLMGAGDTVRLAAAYPILQDLVTITAEVGARWVRVDGEVGARRLPGERSRLAIAGGDLPPPIGRTTRDAASDQPTAQLTDHLSSLISNLTENVFGRLDSDANPYALAAFLRDTVHGDIVKARQEPWHLIPEGDLARQHLDRLAEHTWDLHDTLKARTDDPTSEPVIRSVARHGSWKHALHRAGTAAREAIDHAAETRRAQFEAELRRGDPEVQLTVLSRFSNGLTHLAVLADVDSLLEWDEKAVVSSIRSHRTDGEQVALIPLRQGRPIEGVGLNVGLSTDFPLGDVGEWRLRLLDAHTAELGGHVRDANEALALLSGLADLDDQRRVHPAISVLMAEARTRFDSALDAIARRGDLFCAYLVNDLQELMKRVQAELVGSWSGRTYAHDLVAHVLGHESDEGRAATLRYLAALEWEIDSDRTRTALGI